MKRSTQARNTNEEKASYEAKAPSIRKDELFIHESRLRPLVISPPGRLRPKTVF